MDLEPARSLLDAERTRVQQLLANLGPDRMIMRPSAMRLIRQNHCTARVDDAVAAGLRDRPAMLDRALQRIENGIYGRSIRSGAIPDERLRQTLRPS